MLSVYWLVMFIFFRLRKCKQCDKRFQQTRWTVYVAQRRHLFSHMAFMVCVLRNILLGSDDVNSKKKMLFLDFLFGSQVFCVIRGFNQFYDPTSCRSRYRMANIPFHTEYI